jgi:hypothetical protein
VRESVLVRSEGRREEWGAAGGAGLLLGDFASQSLLASTLNARLESSELW